MKGIPRSRYTNAIDKLVDDLSRPTMVLRFAKADYREHRGAETRAENARRQIHDLIVEYAIETKLVYKEPNVLGD